MNRRIAMSAFSILSALALLGGGAFAAFTSQATATVNTFSTGNANLQIAQDVSNSPGTFGPTITGPTFTGLKPGDSKDFLFWLQNNSSSAINLSTTADVSSILGTQNLDQALLVSWVCDLNTPGFGDDTPSSEFSPRDWLNGGNTNIGTFVPGTPVQCKMTGRLPASADNTVAGQTANFDVVYDATQL